MSRGLEAALAKQQRISLTKTLRTERLVLRPLRVSDARALRAFNKENSTFLAPWNPRARKGSDPLSLVDVASGIGAARKNWRQDRGYAFLLTLADADALTIVGRVTLNNIVRGVFQSTNLGYLVGRAWEGRGLAREAVSAVLRFAFDDVRLHRIEAGIMPHNERSRRLVLALGFEEIGLSRRYLHIDGDWRDHVLYALTREARETSTKGAA